MSPGPAQTSAWESLVTVTAWLSSHSAPTSSLFHAQVVFLLPVKGVGYEKSSDCGVRSLKGHGG